MDETILKMLDALPFGSTISEIAAPLSPICRRIRNKSFMSILPSPLTSQQDEQNDFFAVESFVAFPRLAM
jgi:hypothetical protein